MSNQSGYIYQAGLPPKQVNSLNYTGTPLSTVPVVNVPRAPTVNDGQFPLFTLWRNADPSATLPDAEGDLWYFARVNTATYPLTYVWNKIATGTTPGGTMIGLTDTASTSVLPDGAGFIQLEAGAGITVTSDAINNKLVIALTGGGTGIDSIAVPAGTTPVVPDGTGLVTFNVGSGLTLTGGLNSMTFQTVGGVASSSFEVQANTAPGTDPVVPTAGGVVTVNGAAVAAHSVPIETRSRAANAYNIEAQYGSAVAATDATQSGLLHANNAQFSVDANGFLSLLGGGVTPALVSVNVDANTAPGTDPVVANASGQITITGAQVAAGTVGANVIRTDSLAANSLTVEIQRSTAVGASASANNGVSHYDSTQFTVDANGFVQLIGGGQALDSVIVDASTAPGTNPVAPNVAGQITVTGAQVAAGTVGANVIRTDSLAANAYTVEIQRSTAVSASASANNGVSHFNSTDFTVDSNAFVSANPILLPFGVSNVGITYSAGTFTVCSYDGTALSATNPAYVWIASKTPGLMKRIAVTANQTFTDGAAGQIDNMRWGITSGVNWSTDMPFYLYAVINDAETAIAFMISRIPNRVTSPVAAGIGKAGAVVNTGQGDMFSLANVTVADYESNPCLCLGSFRMQFAGATDSYTVQSLSSSDGIGQFNEQNLFSFPVSQMGNATGSYFNANGGTAPIWDVQGGFYKMDRNGQFNYVFDAGSTSTVTTNGAGAVNLLTSLPIAYQSGSLQNVGGFLITQAAIGKAVLQLTNPPVGSVTSPNIIVYGVGVARNFLNNDCTAANGTQLNLLINYKAYISS